VVLAWLLLTSLTSLPYLLAHYLPPPGRAFQGFFFFTDDQQVYLSNSQQAEDGAFLFRNKLVSEPHEPALVNLEWWLVGVLSRILGRRPFLAYRIVGALAALLLFFVLSRWLRRGGLPDDRLFPALLLLALGGGFGGLLYAAGWLPVGRCLDLSTGLFPFVGLVGNPHFTVATTLFLGSLLSLSESSLRGQALGILLGSALALTRPYDFVLLVGLRGAFVALRYPPREWLARLCAMAGFLPAVSLNYWLFYRNSAFAFYAKTPYEFPATLDFAIALLPVAIVATALWRARAPGQAAWEIHLQLLLWMGFGLFVVLLHPVHYSLQFLMGIGVPLLMSAAIGLSRMGPRALWITIAALGTTPIVTLHLLLQPMPAWYPLRERVEVAYALRPVCRIGDLVLAPADVGLLIGTLTGCKAYVSHEIQPAFPARTVELQRFYGAQDPTERAALLDRHCIRVLVLPGDDDERASRWLPPETTFRRALAVGAGGRAISVYARPSACPP